MPEHSVSLPLWVLLSSVLPLLSYLIGSPYEASEMEFCDWLHQSYLELRVDRPLTEIHMGYEWRQRAVVP